MNDAALCRSRKAIILSTFSSCSIYGRHGFITEYTEWAKITRSNSIVCSVVTVNRSCRLRYFITVDIRMYSTERQMMKTSLARVYHTRVTVYTISAGYYPGLHNRRCKQEPGSHTIIIITSRVRPPNGGRNEANSW